MRYTQRQRQQPGYGQPEGGGFGWGVRQPPSQIREIKKSSFVMEYLLPLAMASTLALVTTLLFVSTVWALKALQVHVAFVCAGAWCLVGVLWPVLVSARYDSDDGEWRLTLPTLAVCGFMGVFSAGLCVCIARLATLEPRHLAPLSAVVFLVSELLWLTVSFGLESFLRSPAMEEHGFREGFGFVFQRFLPWVLGMFGNDDERQEHRPLPPILRAARQAVRPEPEAEDNDEGDNGNGLLELFLTHSARLKTLSRDTMCNPADRMEGGERLTPKDWKRCIDHLRSAGYVEGNDAGNHWAPDQSAATALAALSPTPPERGTGRTGVNNERPMDERANEGGDLG